MSRLVLAAILLLMLTGCRSSKEVQTSGELQTVEETRDISRVAIAKEEHHNSLGQTSIELDSVTITAPGGSMIEARRARIVARGKSESNISECAVSMDSVWQMSVSHEKKENIEKRNTRGNPWLIIVLPGAIVFLVILMLGMGRNFRGRRLNKQVRN